MQDKGSPGIGWGTLVLKKRMNRLRTNLNQEWNLRSLTNAGTTLTCRPLVVLKKYYSIFHLCGPSSYCLFLIWISIVFNSLFLVFTTHCLKERWSINQSMVLYFTQYITLSNVPFKTLSPFFLSSLSQCASEAQRQRSGWTPDWLAPDHLRHWRDQPLWDALCLRGHPGRQILSGHHR